ncbi:MAG: hypothetical protein HQ495_12960 [Alphaproteobacteria bacterium]|nr:hypothetical protein [Alphaproteobacteria bacterium]
MIELHAEAGVDVAVENDIRTCPNNPYETADDQTLIFSFGSPYIIRQDLIDLYGSRVVNSHGAPLPEWRGGGGYSWRILANDRRGNTCFHQVTAGIDRGDILFQRGYVFPSKARFPKDWMEVADREAASAATEFLGALLAGAPISQVSQDETQATYFPRLQTASQAYIDWSWNCDEIERFVLAFSFPYEGAKTYLGDQIVRIMDCRATCGLPKSHSFFRGLIYRADHEYFYVVGDGGSLVVPKNAVEADLRLREGDRLYTPNSLLDQAMALRPVYTPAGLKAPG